MKNKQGCVDWLVEEINKQKVWADPSKLEPIIQQAKAMHKQEMKDLYLAHVTKAPRLREIFEKQFEEYYTNTFDSYDTKRKG